MTKAHVQPDRSALAVVQSAPHLVLICTSCRHKDQSIRPGPALIAALRQALATAGLDREFAVSGTECMAGCDHPCAVAWTAAGKATYLFGDIDPAEDLDDLVTFAMPYHGLDDGWCRAADRPGKLAKCTLGRIPAAPNHTALQGVLP